MKTTTISPSKTIRLGLIGPGNRLRCRVLRGLFKEAPPGQIQIVTAYDPSPGSLKALRDEFGSHIETAASEEAAARHPNVDWVFIGSWNACHARQSVMALNAGKNVFCEKPMATSLAECVAIRDAAQKSGRIFALGFERRYSPYHQKVAEMIASKKIGDVISLEFNSTIEFHHGGFIFGDWRRKVANGGTHLLEKCCHDLDLAYWIVGSLPMSVASFGGKDFFVPKNAYHIDRIGPDAKGVPAYGGWPHSHPHRVNSFSEGADIIDNQVAIIQYANGVRATFHTNCNVSADMPERRYYICGTEGTFRTCSRTLQIDYQRIEQGAKIEHIDMAYVGDHAGGDKVMSKHLLKTLTHGDPPLASIEEGIQSCVTAFAIDQAMNEKRVVDLKPMWAACGMKT